MWRRHAVRECVYFNVIWHHPFAYVFGGSSRGHTKHTHTLACRYAGKSEHMQPYPMKYVRFRLSIFDRIQFGAGGDCLFGTVRRFIDDNIGCLPAAHVSETKRILRLQSILDGVKMHSFSFFSSIPVYLSWLKYLSWMMYANEAMTIVQWDGVQNISKCKRVAAFEAKTKTIECVCFQLAPAWIRDCPVCVMQTISTTSTASSRTIWTMICGWCFCYTPVSIVWPSSFCGSVRNDIADFIRLSVSLSYSFDCEFWPKQIELKCVDQSASESSRVCIAEQRPLCECVATATHLFRVNVHTKAPSHTHSRAHISLLTEKMNINRYEHTRTHTRSLISKVPMLKPV